MFAVTRPTPTRTGSPSSRGDLSTRGDSFAPIFPFASSTPVGLMRRMMEDMDQLFSNFTSWPDTRRQESLPRGGQSALQPSSLRSLWAPQVELFERDNNVVVRADLPGLSRDDVDVEIEDDALIIRGERHNDVDEEQEGYYRSERSYGSFYRAIPLPEGVDSNACKATFKDGVLEVTVPKPQQRVSRGRKIEVK